MSARTSGAIAPEVERALLVVERAAACGQPMTRRQWREVVRLVAWAEGWTGRTEEWREAATRELAAVGIRATPRLFAALTVVARAVADAEDAANAAGAQLLEAIDPGPGPATMHPLRRQLEHHRADERAIRAALALVTRARRSRPARSTTRARRRASA